MCRILARACAAREGRAGEERSAIDAQGRPRGAEVVGRACTCAFIVLHGAAEKRAPSALYKGFVDKRRTANGERRAAESWCGTRGGGVWRVVSGRHGVTAIHAACARRRRDRRAARRDGRASRGHRLRQSTRHSPLGRRHAPPVLVGRIPQSLSLECGFSVCAREPFTDDQKERLGIPPAPLHRP